MNPDDDSALSSGAEKLAKIKKTITKAKNPLDKKQ
jgi:hypothetical protein